MQITRSLVGWVAMSVLATLGSCGVSDTVSPDAITFLDSPTTVPEDPARIEEASVTNDTLRLRVRYAGGLREHGFSLHGFGFLESFPVQVNVVLSHDARGDAGEASLTRDLSFDLSPIKRAYRHSYPDDGPIRLRIHEPGSDQVVTVVGYSF